MLATHSLFAFELDDPYNELISVNDLETVACSRFCTITSQVVSFSDAIFMSVQMVLQRCFNWVRNFHSCRQLWPDGRNNLSPLCPGFGFGSHSGVLMTGHLQSAGSAIAGGWQQLSAEGPRRFLSHQWSDGIIIGRALGLCLLPGQKRLSSGLGCNQAPSSNKWCMSPSSYWAGVSASISMLTGCRSKGKGLHFPLKRAQLASMRHRDNFHFYFTDKITRFCSNGES